VSFKKLLVSITSWAQWRNSRLQSLMPGVALSQGYSTQAVPSGFVLVKNAN
jgi:hypothetical protein